MVTVITRLYKWHPVIDMLYEVMIWRVAVTVERVSLVLPGKLGTVGVASHVAPGVLADDLAALAVEYDERRDPSHTELCTHRSLHDKKEKQIIIRVSLG